MWISYSDSEVNVFHPLCEDAINRAIAGLGKADLYEVLHHQYTGSLEMDFVIRNKNTKKYLCVIEIKRTPADVHSARYQYQAMSYVQMNYAISERPFFILTNLEYAFAFRFASDKPRVFQQMLAPGLYTIGRFSEKNREEYINILADFFKERINDYINDKYEYLITLDMFADYIGNIKGDSKRWKSGLAVLLYEYIRGAFTSVERNGENGLRDIRLFQRRNQWDIVRICQGALHNNFKAIFEYSEDNYLQNIEVRSDLLTNLYNFGRQNTNGNSVADVLHQIVSAGKEHDGEVPTDLELGRVVAVLARQISGELGTNDKICDPAAGSGNLISTASEIYGLNINQIVANDINPYFGELLALRLGLNYVKVVSDKMHPRLTLSDINNLNPDFFNEVKVVVLNPPFVGGVYASQRKQAFYRRINSLAGKDTGTNIGQMPLEAAFLELVTYLVNPGTIISCVFPKTHLTARGIEAQAMRKFLLDRFGLCTIFTYPGKDLFEDVTRDTCVLVGKVLNPMDQISVISSYETIPNLDLHEFSQAINQPLGSKFMPLCAGIVGKKVSKNDMAKQVEGGWREINSELLEAMEFVDKNFREANLFQLISSSGLNMKRGTAGNSGGSDLVFFDSREELSKAFEDIEIPFKAGMRNAELDTLIANKGDSRFLSSSELDNNLLERILDAYLKLPSRKGRQARKQKTKEEWLRILNRESRGAFASQSVLIPRALRRKGKVYLASEEIFVSTNFLVCYGLDEKTSLLLASWISTIFYQLICEVSSKDQEGMRKMEVEDISQTFIPFFDNVSTKTYEKLKQICHTTEFLDLQAPVIRSVDTIWAEELFKESAETLLDEARRLLEYTAHRRNPC